MASIQQIASLIYYLTLTSGFAVFAGVGSVIVYKLEQAGRVPVFDFVLAVLLMTLALFGLVQGLCLIWECISEIYHDHAAGQTDVRVREPLLDSAEDDTEDLEADVERSIQSPICKIFVSEIDDEEEEEEEEEEDMQGYEAEYDSSSGEDLVEPDLREGVPVQKSEVSTPGSAKLVPHGSRKPVLVESALSPMCGEVEYDHV